MLPVADNRSKFTLRKHDKLKSSLEIEALYRDNQYIVSYPLKCHYSFTVINADHSILSVAFVVPKKTYKLATERNRIKRRMREAYRLHYKTIFEQFLLQNEKQLKLFFIYVGKEISDYSIIEKNMNFVLEKLITKS
ncbi:MAG: ribonuclease P protein component [Bacteroidales bacterium]|jgi:ribonuclease P protein component|nr:ribonuclease P protein component [Bacteroidales bacterium]